MSRWLLLTVFSMAPLALGCGSSLQAGLANAPNLGGSPTADNRISDVVSNGRDACGTYAEHGVLWNQIPSCPAAKETHGVSSSASPRLASSVVSVQPSQQTEPSHGLVQPWLNHFYVGWPCAQMSTSSRPSPWAPSSASSSAVLDTSVAECAVP